MEFTITYRTLNGRSFRHYSNMEEALAEIEWLKELGFRPRLVKTQI